MRTWRPGAAHAFEASNKNYKTLELGANINDVEKMRQSLLLYSLAQIQSPYT